MEDLFGKLKTIEFYYQLYMRNGDHNPKSLGRINRETQEKRFESLSRLGSFTNKSVLDLGCGFGDFYGFLQQRYQNVSYTGIDIIEPFIVVAQRKYPSGTFFVHDMFTFTPSKPYDYIIVNGSFSMNMTDNRIYLDLIKRMFSYATIGFGWTMLKMGEHPTNEIFLSRDPRQVKEFCFSLTPYVMVYEDYLPYDFTVFLYHKKQDFF